MDEIRMPRTEFASVGDVVEFLGRLCDRIDSNFNELEARIEEIKEDRNGNEKR